MQLTSRLGPKRIVSSYVSRASGCRVFLSGMLALVLLNIGLTACASPSYERTTNGTTVYLDDLSEAAKVEARQKIMQSLNRGGGTYELGLGDEVEIFFQIDHKPTARPYVISPSDKLHIEFLGDTSNDQTVEVRPDGRISLPLIGAVAAAGKTANSLARELQDRYSRVLSEPKITVNLSQTHSALDDFITVLGSTTKARSLVDKVLPDGTIAVPLLPPLRARGRALKEVQDEIDAGYSAKGLDVSVTLVPRTLRSNSTLVIGEVTKPGRFELERPLTVAMAVARAGGALSTGAMDAVHVFYIAGDGLPHVRSINLNEVLDDFRLEDDMIVPANSIIYVPPTALAKTGRVVSAVMRDILRVQGFSLGGGYFIQ